jgi:polysaccharide biosynthesis protein PslH
MRVLALTHRTPFPPNKGDKIRTFHLLTRLARQAEVHLIAFAEPPSDVEHAGTLQKHFASVTLVPLNMRWQRIRALPYLMTLSPMTVPVFYRGAMSDAVQQFVKLTRPDVIIAESSSMAPYALAHRDVPLVMDFVDADSAKWRSYAERASFPMRAVYAREAYTLARFERDVARTAAVSVVTAPRELTLLREIAPDGRDLRVLANGVDTEHFQPRSEVPAAHSVIFFGAMDYHANVEAAVFLARSVLPKLRAHTPTLSLVIAGANPTSEVSALANLPGVTVTGYIADIRPHVQAASVCAVSLRVARGVQNKVLEAMAMGVPVVASPAAAEGIAARDGTDLVVASVDDDGTTTANAITSLLEDRARMEAIARNARTVVENTYGWQPRADELLALCKHAMSV